MDAGLLVQYPLIAVAVLVSAWVVLKKQFPGPARKLRGTLALALLKPGRAARMQARGRKPAPPASGGADRSGWAGRIEVANGVSRPARPRAHSAGCFTGTASERSSRPPGGKRCTRPASLPQIQ